MDEFGTSDRPDLRAYLQVVARRKVVIFLTTIIAVAVALGYSFLRAPVYSATATVLVPQQQASADLNVGNTQLQQADALQRYLADQQQFAEGDAVKALAHKALGFRATSVIGTSTTADVLTFSATSGNSIEASKIANAYASAYISASRANQVDQYTQQVTALQQSIARLQAKAATLAPTDPQLSALHQSVNTLTQTVEQIQAASQISSEVGPSLINAAQVPTTPALPKTARNGLFGLLAGLAVGVGIAFLIERLDDRVNSRDAAEQASQGSPIIALLPQVDDWRSKESHHIALIEDPTSIAAEAYRTFRTAVQFLGIDEPKKVIALTSSAPGEGKSTAIANLAVSFARTGQRVVVASCDLRRPRVHEFFDVSNEVGLTSVLLGRTPLSSALKAVPGQPGIVVLPSGPVPPNPAEILSTDKVRLLVEELALAADIVLLDCPPVLPVTDALLLSRLADGILVLAAVTSTSKRDLSRTFELLRQVNAPLLGLVLNKVPQGSGYAYGYGYAYEYATRTPPHDLWSEDSAQDSLGSVNQRRSSQGSSR